MGFTTVPTVATNDPWTAAQHNQYIRDNFAAVRPDTGIARRAATQSLTNDTNTAVSLDTEDDDTANFFDIAGNPTRLSFPYTGVFLVIAAGTFAVSATNERRAGLEPNGGAVADVSDFRNAFAQGGVGTNFSLIAITPKTGSDYYELFVYQNSGGALNLNDAKISVATLRDDS